MTQAQLAVWRDRLLTDWAQVREELIGQLKACRRDEWAEKVDHCERDQLVDLTSRLDLPKVEQSVARLKRIDADGSAPPGRKSRCWWAGQAGTRSAFATNSSNCRGWISTC
ncbi:hypothetical protein R5M74_06395 [Aeromonas hydrophila]|nr:hypothetical protein R5M74_06395 [Aeromonas hydrophila]